MLQDHLARTPGLTRCCGFLTQKHSGGFYFEIKNVWVQVGGGESREAKHLFACDQLVFNSWHPLWSPEPRKTREGKEERKEERERERGREGGREQ